MTDSLQLGFAGMVQQEPPDAHARMVLYGQRGPWPVTELQRKLLNILIFHLGAQSAITLRDLAEKLERLMRPRPTDREIKDAFRGLVVDFKIRIGTSRSKPPVGYYLVTSAQEARDAAQPYISEIVQLAKRVRVLLEPHDLAELAGQQWLDLLLANPELEDHDPKEAA